MFKGTRGIIALTAAAVLVVAIAYSGYMSSQSEGETTAASDPAAQLRVTLDPNGFTEEENKVINETRKIMGDATIGVCPTCVRVPVKVEITFRLND